MLIRLRAASGAALVSAVLAVEAFAAAPATYPARPIRMIVAQTAGGNADIIARAFAAGLGERLGQTVVVDNRGGGSGIIGTELAARAPADGYTVLLVPSSFGVNPAAFRKLPYDQLRELAPITLLSRAPNVLVVGPALQIKSVQDLVQAARANPGKLTFGSSGNMGSPHLAGELFKLMAGVDMTHVPFKGAAAAQVDLMAGRISLSFASLPSTLPHMKSGRVRGIAVTTEKRFSLLPELPTVSESGLAGFETSAWQGFTLPAATPRAIVAQLHAASIAVLNQPSMRERLTQDGAEVVGSSPDEFWVFVKAQISKWTKVVKAAGLSPE